MPAGETSTGSSFHAPSSSCDPLQSELFRGIVAGGLAEGRGGMLSMKDVFGMIIIICTLYVPICMSTGIVFDRYNNYMPSYTLYHCLFVSPDPKGPEQK